MKLARRLKLTKPGSDPEFVRFAREAAETLTLDEAVAAWPRVASARAEIADVLVVWVGERPELDMGELEEVSFKLDDRPLTEAVRAVKPFVVFVVGKPSMRGKVHVLQREGLMVHAVGTCHPDTPGAAAKIREDVRFLREVVREMKSILF